MSRHVRQDLPRGVQKARQSDPGLEPHTMTNHEGQFTNANNNPFPVPTNYIDGAHEQVDTRTGDVVKKEQGR